SIACNHRLSRVGAARAIGLVVTVACIALVPQNALRIVIGSGGVNTTGTLTPGFSYVGTTNNSSAVYLGQGYVLTAFHVSPATTTVFNLPSLGAQTYAKVTGSEVRIRNGVNNTGSVVDLVVYKIQPNIN